MGINERKDKEKEIRRNDILEAAEKVFFTKGYTNATMDDVAKEAEFSKRTVYVYFSSKEEIYFEIMVRGYKLLNSMIEEEVKKTLQYTAIDRLRQIGSILYKFNIDYPDYFKAIMEYENGDRDFETITADKAKEECYMQGEKILGYLNDALKIGVEGGELRPDINILSTSLVLWSCVIGVFNTVKKKEKYIKHYHKMDSEKIVDDAFELLIRSIKRMEG